MIYLTQDMSGNVKYAGVWRFKKITPCSIHLHIIKYLYTKHKKIIILIIINIKIVRKYTRRLNVTQYYNNITNYNVPTIKTMSVCGWIVECRHQWTPLLCVGI